MHWIAITRTQEQWNSSRFAKVAATKTSTLTLELQHRFNVRIEDTHSVEIKMDIKLVADPPPQTDNLNIKLLHLDTSTFQIDDRDDGRKSQGL